MKSLFLGLLLLRVLILIGSLSVFLTYASIHPSVWCVIERLKISLSLNLSYNTLLYPYPRKARHMQKSRYPNLSNHLSKTPCSVQSQKCLWKFFCSFMRSGRKCWNRWFWLRKEKYWTLCYLVLCLCEHTLGYVAPADLDHLSTLSSSAESVPLLL